jgi:hypothetical protein
MFSVNLAIANCQLTKSAEDMVLAEDGGQVETKGPPVGDVRFQVNVKAEVLDQDTPHRSSSQ